MAKNKNNQTEYRCKDCIHEYDRHEKDYKGDFFLCKCPFHEFSRFLNGYTCEHFKKKTSIK